MTLLAIMLFYHMTSCLCSALVLALVGWMSSVLRSRQQNIGISYSLTEVSSRMCKIKLRHVSVSFH